MPQSDIEHTPPRVEEIWPVYVPSKGRPNGSTMSVLAADGVSFTTVVEPQDYQKYGLPEGPGMVSVTSLPFDNQGIAFVRNWICEEARMRGHRWFWMLDDDIKGFYIVENARLKKASAHQVLFEAQQIFTRLGQVALGALEYGQFAWSAKKDYAIGYCDVAVAINTARTMGCAYKPDTKEDRDFALQVLTKGYLAVRASRCAFQAPKIGSNEGGLHTEYQLNRDAAWAKRMVADWPGLCSLVTKPDGRLDAKIKWSVFRPK